MSMLYKMFVIMRMIRHLVAGGKFGVWGRVIAWGV